MFERDGVGNGDSMSASMGETSWSFASCGSAPYTVSLGIAVEKDGAIWRTRRNTSFQLVTLAFPDRASRRYGFAMKFIRFARLGNSVTVTSLLLLSSPCIPSSHSPLPSCVSLSLVRQSPLYTTGIRLGVV